MPDRDFVPLSEALSWIAFGTALDRENLESAIAENAFAPLDAESALAEAMAQFAERASSGRIRMRAKYREGPAADSPEILTNDIEPIRLTDFAQFNSLYDGLRYGVGLTWTKVNDGLHLATPRRADSYRSVTVNRADLVKCFPPSSIRTRLTVGAECKCRAWLLTEFEADPDKKRSKKSYQDEAVQRFGSLSQRGFLRVWADVAPQAGRSTPGRKS